MCYMNYVHRIITLYPIVVPVQLNHGGGGSALSRLQTDQALRGVPTLKFVGLVPAFGLGLLVQPSLGLSHILIDVRSGH